MRTSRLFIRVNGNWKELDLFGDLTLPLNYAVAEIRDISKRSTNYSLDFDLPNTEHNANILDHIYKIESFGGAVEMLQKYEALVQVNDVTCFEGYFQIKKIITDDLKRVTYRCIVYSNLKDFVETLGNTTLRGNTNAADDLDFSEYSQTAAQMTLSKFKTMLNSYGTGKTGWGLTLIDKTNKAGVNFSGNCQDWYCEEITPYLFVKEIWDKIFAQAGYSYESEFLAGNATLYGYPDPTNLVYPFANNNKKLGDSDNWQKITAGGAFDWTSGYYDMNIPHEWVFANSGNYIDYPSSFTLTNHNMPDDRTHWQFTAPYASSYHVKFKIPISLKCELHPYDHSSEQWLPQYTGAVSCGDTSKEFLMWTRLGKIHGGTTTYITSWGNFKNYESSYTTGADGRLLLESQEVSYEGDIRLQAGDKLFLTTAIQMEVAYYDQTWEKWYSYLQYRGQAGWVSVFPYPAIVEMTQSAGVEIWSATQNDYFGEGLPFNPTHILNPKTKKWDFVNSIIKLYNLYVEDIGDKKFRIEPRDLYYATDVKRDFTDKVDTSSMSFTRVDTYIYSNVNFKFAQDKDVMTEAYNSTYLIPYGEYVLEGALSSGQDAIDIKPVFGTSMCGVVNAQTSVLQCPKMYAFKSNSDVVNVDKEYSDRVFYIWQNAMASHSSINNTVRIKSRYSSSTQTQSTYYCADILNAGYGSDTQVLSWGDNEEYLENLGDGTVSDGNLYNRFYSKMLSELNDPEARILSCRMYLTADDIRNIRLSDTITVGNVDYRVNAIKQWEGYSVPTEVELIKIVRPTYGYVPTRYEMHMESRLESNAQLNTMKGATADDDGASGWVPTPEAGDEEKFLRGDGTWQTVESGNTYTGVAPIDITNTEISLNVGGGLEVGDHDELTVKLDTTTMTLNANGEITAYIPDIRVKHINYIDEVFDSKDFNWLDIDGTRDMTIVVNDYNTDDNLNTYRYFRLDTSNPEEENLYIFESDSEYLTYRNNNTWSIARKPLDVQRIRVGNDYVSPIEGIITLAAGSNVTLTSSGSTITIAAPALSDFIDTQDDAYIDYTLVAGTAAPSNNWITKNTYASKNTYNQTTGAGRFYLKPNAFLGGADTNDYTPFPQSTTLLTIDFRNSRLISLGNRSFKNCTGLTTVYFGNTIESVGISCFEGCTSLETLSTWHFSVIETNAFRGCTSLTALNFNSNQTVRSIGYGAFYGCTGLTGVTFTNSLISLGAYAFKDCTSLTSIAFTGNGLEYIPRNCFEGCTSLTSVNIPNEIQSIHESAFKNCNHLTTITLPLTLTSIGYQAFNGIASPFTVTCNADIPPYCANGAFLTQTEWRRPTSSTGNKLLVPSNWVNTYKGYGTNLLDNAGNGWCLQFALADIDAIP